MAQRPLEGASPSASSAENRPLHILPAALADDSDHEAFVVVVRDAGDFRRWLADGNPALQWIEVHGLLDEAEVWQDAAREGNGVPLDVVMADPASEYSKLYRLVDVRGARSVRVSIPVREGFLKALRLAASIQLPVRLLPGQPDAAVQAELEQALDFYLRDPMVEAPFEYFHSALASLQTGEPGSLWMALEADPVVYHRVDGEGGPESAPATFVGDHVAKVTAEAECGGCCWLGFCQGYFKQPDPAYSCGGVIRVFERLGEAAEEMRADLSAAEPSGEGEGSPGDG